MNVSVTIETRSPQETRLLGEEIGKSLSPGSVITLDGDLGSGKTTFVQGIGKGLGVPEDCYITSPTYTLINEYPGRQRLFHIDLYRLGDSLEAEELGLEDILYGSGITVIEWPDRLPETLLGAYLSMRIDVTGEASRRMTITAIGLENMDWIQNIRNRMKEKKWH